MIKKITDKKRGLLIVVSAPAGSGKDTIIEKALSKNESLRYSVSATTRRARDNEEDGTNYFFKTRGDFEKMIQAGEFVEYAEYVGNYYGTPRASVEKMIKEGFDAVLKIDVKGAENIKNLFPQSVLVFIMPPSVKILSERLTSRGTETFFEINSRLERAKHEINFAENYDYCIVNNNVDDAVEEFLAIIKAEKLSVKRGLRKLPDFNYD